MNRRNRAAGTQAAIAAAAAAVAVVMAVAAIRIDTQQSEKAVDMKEFTVQAVEKMLGLKLLLLSFIVLSLPLAKPAAIIAHQGTQKICSFIMHTEDCGKHC